MRSGVDDVNKEVRNFGWTTINRMLLTIHIVCIFRILMSHTVIHIEKDESNNNGSTMNIWR